MCWYRTARNDGYNHLRGSLGAFVKLWKATISFIVSVCPSVRMEQLGSHRKDFQEIWCFYRLSAWNNSVPTGRIFMKFGVLIVCPPGRTRFPPEGFSWNLMFLPLVRLEKLGSYRKNFHEILCFYRLSAWNNSVPTWRIFMKFDVLTACSPGTTRLPPEGFSWNLMFLPSVRMEQLGSHLKDFHEIWCFYRLSAWNNSVPTGRIFMKFDVLPSVRMEQLGSHRRDFHEIWCFYLLSAWNISVPTGRIFMKFNIWIFFETLSRNLKFR